MKVADLIASRQAMWEELESICSLINGGSKLDPVTIERFSALYRSACADLALAEAYQLPPNTVDYLHRLVARAHNQLYRSRSFRLRQWANVIFRQTPKRIFHDPCVHLATVLFWGLFVMSAFLAYDNTIWPGFTEKILGEDQMDMMRTMHSSGGGGIGIAGNSAAFGFYVVHNAGIGLQCFVTMLGVLPGMITLAFNAMQLGTVFGYMFRADPGGASENFQRFVTAHGPFELTAIVLSAGAGLRIGISWIKTNGLGRLDSMVKASREALPIAMTAVLLFCLAAVIEGFISPQPDADVPWAVKGIIAALSNFALLFYFVILGFPQPGDEEPERW
jgi:uncharacterized membrane protein SpoIIM required for sporulation